MADVPDLVLVLVLVAFFALLALAARRLARGERP